MQDNIAARKIGRDRARASSAAGDRIKPAKGKGVQSAGFRPNLSG
jgi:hypothetical protein